MAKRRVYMSDTRIRECQRLVAPLLRKARRRLDWQKKKRKTKQTIFAELRMLYKQRKQEEWKLCDACDYEDKFWISHGDMILCEVCYDEIEAAAEYN